MNNIKTAVFYIDDLKQKQENEKQDKDFYDTILSRADDMCDIDEGRCISKTENMKQDTIQNPINKVSANSVY